jgi:hypothetical protein
LTLWFFFMFFFWGIGTLFSRGGTGVCFSLVEGGTGVCLFLWGDQYTIFFSIADFLFIPDLGGTMAPAGPPIGPSLSIINKVVWKRILIRKLHGNFPYKEMNHHPLTFMFALHH